MDQDTQQSIKEQFQKLPKIFQEAITAVPWEKRSIDILSSLDLTAEQKESVKRETMFVIYGFESPVSYMENLMNEGGISKNDALFIAERTDEDIFEAISKKAAELGKKVVEEPIVITKETKQEVIQKLAQRVEVAKQGGTNMSPSVPKIVPEIHPMVKKGKMVHEVPHVETPVPKITPAAEPTLQNPEPTQPIGKTSTPEPKKSSTPANPHYSGGLDPYREPLN